MRATISTTWFVCLGSRRVECDGHQGSSRRQLATIEWRRFPSRDVPLPYCQIVHASIQRLGLLHAVHQGSDRCDQSRQTSNQRDHELISGHFFFFFTVGVLYLASSHRFLAVIVRLRLIRLRRN